MMKNAINQQDKEAGQWEIVVYTDKYKDQVVQFILGILKDEFNLDIALPDLDNFREVYQNNDGNLWTALDKGNVVGTIALRNYGMGRGMLKRMFIDKKYRGKGLADELFKALVEFAKAKKYKEIYLTTLPEMVAAIKFYQKKGFHQIAGLPPGIPDYNDPIFYKLDI